MKTEIRKGQYNDLQSILSLVKELADFELSGDQVTATIHDYQKGFKDGSFETLVAINESGISGMALYYLTWSTWRGKMLYLEDLVVREKERRAGIGQRLFDTFIQRAKELECTMVKWQVLDWNEPAINFYNRNGATIEKEWWNVKLIF